MKGIILKHTKLLAYGVVSLLQLGIIIIWAAQYESRPKTSIVAGVLALVTSLTACALSFVEHSKSERPSMLLNVYLLISLIFDATILRTLWLIPYYPTIRILFTTSFILKGILVLLEAKEKRRHLNRETDELRSPEEFGRLYNQAIFGWLVGLIQMGYHQIMSSEDLYPVNEDMKAESLGWQFWQAWNTSK